ncbi:ABC transporter ATP-binding protein [Mangrovactinospora gilvigrisea]|uniref:ABC transporter ATP-binding protein n=1 Tax=Mangrovactinospora gilvigrisea TaxID=1428644 RepID=UPI0009A0EEC7|nr:ABC transporter transmembrane domain-containing protein [Mangrovactinospora gilvigrisea]
MSPFRIGRPSRTGPAARMFGYLRRHPGALAGLAAVPLPSLLGVVPPLIVRHVVDAALSAHRAPLAPWLTLLAVLAAVRFAASAASRYASERLASGVERDLRVDAFAALQRLDGRPAGLREPGHVLGRMTGDISLVRLAVADLPVLVSNLVLCGFSLVAMVVLAPLLSVVALAAMAPAVVFVRRSRRLNPPAQLTASRASAAAAGRVARAVRGMRVVQAFGRQQHERDAYGAAVDAQLAAQLRLVRLQAGTGSALQAIPALGQAGVLLLGGWLVLRGDVTPGTFAAFGAYLAMALRPVRILAAMAGLLPRAAIALRRVLEIVDARPRIIDRPGARPLPDGPLGVRFDGVTVRDDAGRAVLDGLDLEIRPGETVALTGPSGSGKTTAALLLPRLIDPDAGRVLIGGQDVRDTALDALRGRIGAVLDDGFLIAGTIAENIAYGRPAADRAAVVEAAHAAGVDEFAERLPDGYDSMVGERGMTLSGGQRQRVALARALLTAPDVLVLDDATSAVDAQIEERIHATLRGLLRGRTVLLIAHRRTTLSLADRVIHLPPASNTPREPATASQAPRAGAAPTPDSPVHLAPPPPRAGCRGGGAAKATADSPIHPAPTPPRAKRRRGGAAKAAALLTVSAAAALVGPLALRRGLDGALAHSPHATATLLLATAAAALAAGVLWISTAAATTAAGTAAHTRAAATRRRLFAHLTALDPGQSDRAALTRFTADVDSVTSFRANSLPTVLAQLLTAAGALAALLALDPALAWPAPALVPVVAAATTWYRARALRAHRAARKRLAEANARVQENLDGLRTVHLFRRADHDIAAFAALADERRRLQLRGNTAFSLTVAFTWLLTDAGTALVLILAAPGLAGRTVTAGTVTALVAYLAMFFQPVASLSATLDDYLKAAVGARAVRALLETRPAVPALPDAAPPDPDRAGTPTELALRDVRFSYPGAAATAPALSGLTATIRPGTRVAVVGATGAGKSTLVKLLARFHDPSAGSVLADGRDLRTLDPDAHRRRLGIVLQEPHLAAAVLPPGRATVRDAVAYGRPDATDDEVVRAARAVGAHEAIAALPDGYATPLGDTGGAELPAGTRQLIALARAELVDPDVLLLDEATAVLDPEADARVARAVAQLSRRRTTVIVAHRLDTARAADRILVLDGGRLAEDGSHDQLLARGGRYADLWRAYIGSGPTTSNSAPSGSSSPAIRP